MPGPIAFSQVSKGSGWTANSSAGDKTSVVTDYVNGVDATMVTALNLVSANLGTNVSSAFDVIVLLRKKVQALETALAANTLPNA